MRWRITSWPWPPSTARTTMLGDDLLACLMGDIYTNVEKTMIELQRQATVAETRSAFQHAMEHRFIATVERLTRRKVAQFISTPHVGPGPRARALHARRLTPER
jgi:uncharacterized protein YbcI